jgi:hypothetical protein
MAKMPVVKTAVARTQDTAEAACHDDIRGDDNEELWAEVRQRYPDRSYKLSEIAELVGLSTISLSLEAKRRGWQSPRPRRPKLRRPKPRRPNLGLRLLNCPRRKNQKKRRRKATCWATCAQRLRAS